MNSSVLFLLLALAGPLAAAEKTTKPGAKGAAPEKAEKPAAPATPAAPAPSEILPPPPVRLAFDGITGAAFGTATYDRQTMRVAADKFEVLRKCVADLNFSNLTKLHSLMRSAHEALLKIEAEGATFEKSIEREKARADKAEADYEKLKSDKNVGGKRAVAAAVTAEKQAADKAQNFKENVERLEAAKKKHDDAVKAAADAYVAAKGEFEKALSAAQPAYETFRKEAGFPEPK